MSVEAQSQHQSSSSGAVDWSQTSTNAPVFDELHTDDDKLREPWPRLVDGISRLGRDELLRRSEQAALQVLDNGVSFNAFGSEKPRLWQLDLLPLALRAEDWSRLTEGLKQRATLFNRILADLYGEQTLVRDGVIPPRIVFANARFRRGFHDLPVPHGHLQLCGFELARGSNGDWFVMADRTANPYGTGYALENRLVASRALPQLVRENRVRRLAPFFMSQQNTLKRLCPRKEENPRVVLLSSGPQHPYYFEDAYLARYLGLPIVESGDLAVRDNIVWIKTLAGLTRVDVILRRIPEDVCDPLELGGNSPHGIPGLLQAIRSGNVAITNSLGSGLVESPVVMAFLPELCEHLLGEILQVPSIATWWCGRDDDREYVLGRLDELVIKPAFEHSGGMEIMVDQLDAAARAALVVDINERPHDFVAQEKILRSAAPVLTQKGLSVGHVALRSFLVSREESWHPMPGALVRVADIAGPMELSIAAGEYSKDLWVISDAPVEPVSLLRTTAEDIEIQRGGEDLPSRAADHLYWLGREIERCESHARLLREIVNALMTGDDLSDVPALPALVLAVGESGTLQAVHVTAVLPLQQVADLLPPAIFDGNHDQSLRSTVEEIHRLASVVRDRISYDNWRVINRIEQNFRPLTQHPTVESGEALAALDRLITDLAACSGLANDAMTRDSAWRFLDIGRRLQQSLQHLGVIRNTLVDVSDAEPAVLEALLDASACRKTYRSRYLNRLHAAPVIDLLLNDATHPRSVLFQLEELHQHIEALPAPDETQTLSEHSRLILDAIHSVRMSRPKELAVDENRSRRALNELVVATEQRLNDLADLLSRTYLIHAGPLRQMD